MIEPLRRTNNLFDEVTPESYFYKVRKSTDSNKKVRKSTDSNKKFRKSTYNN